MRKLLVLSLAALLTVAVFTGCGQKPATGPASTAPTATTTIQKQWTIGMSQCNLGEPWRVQMNADVKAAADKHPELKMIYQDAQNNTNTQQSQVRELVSRGVNLIIVSPKEAVPLTLPVAEAYKQGIPVIILDRKVKGDQFTQFIGADNVNSILDSVSCRCATVISSRPALRLPLRSAVIESFRTTRSCLARVIASSGVPGAGSRTMPVIISRCDL